MKTVTLFAECLLSKCGFGDGDMLDELWDELEAAGFPEGASHDVLCELVERNLKPLLPDDVKLYRICSIHNPIRAEYEDDQYDSLHARIEHISVTLTSDQIIAVAKEMRDNNVIDVEAREIIDTPLLTNDKRP